MNFNFDNDRPIYMQLMEHIKLNIAAGHLLPGEKIPSVREYAVQLKVNPNTVQKALAELENLELIYTERTNGKFVTTDKKLIKKYKEEYAKEKAENYFSAMKKLGFNENDAIEYLKKRGEK